MQLRIWPMLTGYRGAPAVDVESVLDAVMAVQAFAMEHATRLYEVEINPLMCTVEGAVAVDALISWLPAETEGEGATDEAS